ncbi:hypothetical protein F5H01DRAFT_378826 [Linnemannia elongata]|nr:hypothetical protein F5H01DRAFT_378826 [Linnemannia elongata]
MTDIHAAATPRTRTIDLGDGLIMRWSTKDDSKHVQELVGDSFRWLLFGPPLTPGVIPPPNKIVMAGARRLLSGVNATMSEFNYALVEDTKRKGTDKNPIVACTSIHRVRAYYGSVKLFFGKPELIATDPEYRNRGLVRKLLNEMIHPESEARGDALQFIPGIPHFYRQFGYEYAMCSFGASSIKNVQSLPSLSKGKTEPYTLRKATLADIPYLVKLSERESLSPHTPFGLFYGPEYWKYTIHDYVEIMENENDVPRDSYIFVDAATGKDVGFAIVTHAFGLKVEAIALDKEQAHSWNDVLFPVLRQIVANEKTSLEAKKSKTTDPEAAKAIKTDGFPILLQIHPAHPAYALLGTLVSPPQDKPGFRIMVRINDYPQFIRTVTPELERRLAESPMAGLSGKLQFDFFRKVEGNKGKGLEIEFKKGKLVDVKDWAKQLPEKDVEDYLAIKARGEEDQIPTLYEASLAPLTFNNLLTGERSFRDLIWSHGETTYGNDATRLLIDILFPKGEQHVDTFFW